LRRLGSLAARGQVWLRIPLALAWVAGVIYVAVAYPPLSGASGATPESILPHDASALRAERISASRFSFPVTTRTVIVIRDPRGLSFGRQAQIVRLGTSLTLGRVPGFEAVAGALPVTDTLLGAPLAKHPGTTAILYLYFRPSAGSGTRVALARRLARRIGRRPGEFVGVTGALPAQHEQSRVINNLLPWVELASLLLVIVAVGLHFRALGTSLTALAAVVGSYVVAARLVQQFAELTRVELPEEVKPVLVVLVFGITTDYCIFFMSRFRALLAEGLERRAAGAPLIGEISPIVLAAGATVAAGTAALGVANLAFLRAFGPGLAIGVLVAAASAVLLLPCVLAAIGPALYWPRGIRRTSTGGARADGRRTSGSAGASAAGTDERAGAGAGSSQSSPTSPPPGEAGSRGAGGKPSRLSTARAAARHPAVAAALAMAAILAGASGLHALRVGDEIVTSLPAGNEVRQAYTEAQRGFAPGTISPVVVVVQGRSVATRRAALVGLQESLQGQRGVAAVIGPSQQPLARRFGFVLGQGGGSARYIVFLSSDPLGPVAISDTETLAARMPTLLRRAGLSGMHALVAGDPALGANVVSSVVGSLTEVAPVMLVAIFLVIALFLRALVAPTYLILTSVLAAASALGLTAYFLQDVVGYPGIAYYAIFTVSVLLVSLGSDYNVYMAGRIWQEGGRRARISEAVARAGEKAASPIRVAGLILALSFALLAIVPVRGFREIAFGMAVGLVIDAFIVRAVLVPALVVLVGRKSAWPGRRFTRAAKLAHESPAPGGAPEPPAG
jgi:putative drug exporter of the RND superfamily